MANAESRESVPAVVETILAFKTNASRIVAKALLTASGLKGSPNSSQNTRSGNRTVSRSNNGRLTEPLFR
jgi:hypothetical protein